MKYEGFCEEIRQELLSNSEDEESLLFKEEKFASLACEYLTNADITKGFNASAHDSQMGKVTGSFIYGDGEFLDLFTAYYDDFAPYLSDVQSEIEHRLERLKLFLYNSLAGRYKELEESSSAFGVAHQIHKGKNNLSKIRLFIIINRAMKKSVEKSIKINGFDCEVNVVDMKAIYELAAGISQKQAIEIDVKGEFKSHVPFIKVHSASEEYACYLCSFPGTLLVEIYKKYGPALLEKNVRSFLQVRGKVNIAIRKTIQEHPQRFLAYNNGIACVAQKVSSSEDSDGIKIINKITNLQIVNGGQTTASLYHACYNDKEDISNINVQVKITVVSSKDLAEEFVPKISQYANSQNKVNVADFSANDEYHKNIASISRNIWTPGIRRNGAKTVWFYERARGQYAEERSRLAKNRQKGFEAKYPANQKITKTELAKYIMAWEQHPHHVCKGAEINFQEFSNKIKDGWKPKVDEYYYKRIVSKAILFKKVDAIVAKEEFGGYKSQITAYAVSLISFLTSQSIDLENIWDLQKLPKGTDREIAAVCRFVHKQITNPRDGKNIAEWCKRLECWENIEKISLKRRFNLKKLAPGTAAPGNAIKGMKACGKDEMRGADEADAKAQ